MGVESVDQGTVAPDQQIQASTSPTSRAPLIRRKSSPLSSEGVNPSEMDFTETMDALTKALITSEESGRKRLTIQCGMARLPVLEDFVIDLGPALRVCRPALATEERLESMEKRISVEAHLGTRKAPERKHGIGTSEAPKQKRRARGCKTRNTNLQGNKKVPCSTMEHFRSRHTKVLSFEGLPYN